VRIQSLKHLVLAVGGIGAPRRIVVLGSSSLLGSFPMLGEAGQPVEASMDADLLVEPCDEQLAKVLDEALGEERTFQSRYGYHADILRPEITELLPRGWEERLVALEECEGVFCLEPHDLAVAKLQAGRPKDLALLTTLLERKMLVAETVSQRLAMTRMTESLIVTTHGRLNEAVKAAARDAALS
jgi:hypothetical protein